MNEKIYSLEEFEGLSDVGEERSKYGDVWELFDEEVKGKGYNMKVIIGIVKKISRRLNSELGDSKWIDSIVRGRIERKVKKDKVLKRFDDRYVVYYFKE